MKIELNTIYNMDCLEGMKAIPDGSVDAIICDLPYGTMKGIEKCAGWHSGAFDWDEIIPSAPLFEQYERVLRKAGAIILFRQEPYTSHLRTLNPKNIDFCYPMIWKKNAAGNIMGAAKSPLGYFEDINVFRKANPLHDFDCAHPLRPYFAKVLEFIGKPKKEIMDAVGSCADHTFRCNSSQFALCTEETYKELIARFSIDKMDGFRSYEDLKAEDSTFIIKKEFEPTFNLPEGAKSMSNVLEFPKDRKDTFHPTQKPVALISHLIKTYTNEGETILDNCMGSGTSAIAAIRTRRNYIGFELNEEYYRKSLDRIQRELSQPSLNFNE